MTNEDDYKRIEKELFQVVKIRKLLEKDLKELVYLRHENKQHDELVNYYTGIIEKYEWLLEESKNE